MNNNNTWQKTYKGYTVQIVGLSHHIYRPAQEIPTYDCRGYKSYVLVSSMEAAKRWINADMATTY